MEAIEYRHIWKEAIHLCEIEPNQEEAEAFVANYYDKDNRIYCPMNNRTLLLTFVGLVVYEKKFQMKYGSTTPAAFCYQELLNRADNKIMDREFVYDLGDWAADYSDNGYVPMGNYRGYGPRKYFAFLRDYKQRITLEKQAKKERLKKKHFIGIAKVEAAKLKHQERLTTIQQLREKNVDESLLIIEQSEESIFYYFELIEEWFRKKSLSVSQTDKILSLFPLKSTRHNNRKRKYLLSIVSKS